MRDKVNVLMFVTCLSCWAGAAVAGSVPAFTITDPNAPSLDDFGASVALSADGNTLLVGAPEIIATTVSGAVAQVGRAYLFSRTRGGFNSHPVLTLQDPEPLQLDEFGANLAISGDGSTLLITASGGDSGVPRVYVFDVASGGAPLAMLESPDGGGDCFGQSLAISNNNVALVGADCATVNGIGWVGKVYIYSRSNGSWSPSPIAVLTESVPTQNDFFGTSVALSADGTTALIGSDDYSSTDPIGHAYVFLRTGNVWHIAPDAVFTDPATSAGSMFGSTVSLSAEGNTALVGAGNESGGKSAYVFHRTDNVWSNVAAFDAPTAQTGSGFVNTVKLSADGNTALVGLLTGTGAAQVFVRGNAGNWSSRATQLLNDPADANGDDYGWSGALSADGSLNVIGSPYAVAHSAPAGSLFSAIPGPGIVYVYSDATGTTDTQKAGNASGSSSNGAGSFAPLILLCLLMLVLLARTKFMVAIFKETPRHD